MALPIDLPAPEGEKVCRRCRISKPFSELKKDNRYGGGYSSFCKDCHKAASIAWQKANPEKLKEARKNYYARLRAEGRPRKRKPTPESTRRSNLWKNYRISIEDWDRMFEEQNGCCAICLRHQSSQAKRLHVDHDHACCASTPTCGRCTRGLLCSRCNTSVTTTLSEPGVLERLVIYLGKGQVLNASV